MTKQTKLSNKSKGILAAWIAILLIAGIFAGCSSAKKSTTSTKTAATKSISVLSREDGSGTRGAFIELFGIEEKDANGNKIDNTTDMAEVTNSTAVMLTTVAGNKGAIGYVSLGSLDSSVKALKVDGVEATTTNVKNGTYKASRPFNIVTKSKVSAASQDFINYILSDEGQKIVEANGYVSVSSTGAYKKSGATGKVTVAGSSSVTPVMEKLQEAYKKVNSKVVVEVQQSDSTTGISSATDGLCDIGMASRELESAETAKGVKATVIAKDGIAVIVNKANTLTNISSDAVKEIYVGNTTEWSQVK